MSQKAMQRPETDRDDAARQKSHARLRVAEPQDGGGVEALPDPVESGYNLPFTD
jgi:hypothetical protein